MNMLKRDMRLFCRCLLVAVLFVLTLGAIGVGTVAAVGSGGSDAFKPPEVEVVDKENSLLSRMVIGFVENSDYVAPLFRVNSMKEKEALRRFAEGSCSAVILLPEGFVEDISYGRTSHGKILLSESLGAYSYVVESAACFGEKMLAAGQYGVFVGEELIRDYGRSSQEHEHFLIAVNSRLLKEALGANENYFDIITAEYQNTALSPEQYYLTAWLAFVLSLVGLFFWKLYRTDLNRSMVTRLLSYGVKEWQFVVGKIAYPFLFQLGMLVLVGGFVDQRSDLVLSIKTVASVLLALVLTSGLSYALAVNMKNELMISASLSFCGLLLCGGVIPRPLLPDLFCLLGDLSPVGVIRALLSPCLAGESGILVYVYALVYLGLIVVLIKRGMKRYMTGGAE